VDPADVDLVIVATASPDYLMPATGVLVARDLGATRAAGFDLNAACSGFVFGLATGASFVTSGMYRQVLVVGVDLLSRYLDWTDRNTCVLFGDGAGAVLLSASDGPGGLVGMRRGDHHPRWRDRPSRDRRDGARPSALHADGRQGGLPLRHPAAGGDDRGRRIRRGTADG
jgi:3-oxoacyl-[acyl-carrier-protein] synthase III